MNHTPLRPPRDAFATMVSSDPLTGPVTSRTDDPPATGQPIARGGSLLERLERWVWSGRQRDLERALTSSVDIADVESRLRDRERRLLQRYY